MAPTEAIEEAIRSAVPAGKVSVWRDVMGERHRIEFSLTDEQLRGAAMNIGGAVASGYREGVHRLAVRVNPWLSRYHFPRARR